MNHLILPTLLFCSSACLVTPIAWAQDASYVMDQVEVQGKDTQSILGDSALRTLVLSGEALQRNHAKTLEDALRYTPGIDIKPIGNSAENGSSISIQGLDPSQILIMVDGNPVTPNSGDMVDIVDVSQVLVGNVDRIEIVQGGASAIYGGSAMGGVVNVITKNPSKSFTYSADISAGDWGEKSEEDSTARQSALISAAGQSGKLASQLSVNVLNQLGFDSTPNEIGSDGWHGYKHNVSGKVKYAFAPHNTLTISPSFYQAQISTYVESRAINETVRERTSNQTRNTLGATYFGLIDSTHVKFHVSHQNYQEEKEGTNANKLDQTSKNQRYQLKVDQPFEHHSLSINLEHQYEYLDQFNLSKEEAIIAGQSKRSTDLALSNSWYGYYNGDLEIVPAIRLNQDDQYGQHISPMLSAMFTGDWLNGTLTVRSALSEGYKPPSLMELYWEFDHNGDIMYFGNPDLTPETSINTQLGIEFLTADKSRYEVHLFNNEISDLIAEQSNPEKADELEGVSTVYEFQNVKSARTRGANLSYLKILNNWNISLGYSYLDAKNLVTGKQLPKKSKDSVNIGLTFGHSKPMNISFKYRFNSKQYADFDNTQVIDDFDVIDFKFNHTVTRNIGWYLGIDNLLDNNPNSYSTSGAHGSSDNDAYTKTPRYMYIGFKITNH